MDQALGKYGVLALRLSLGTLFLAHGLLKLLVFTIPGTVAYFEKLGFPGFFAYLTIFAELGGGLLLLTGAFTRWVALALLPLMIGATMQHVGNGWLFTAPGGGWEYPVFWIAALVAQALLGDGAYALGPYLTRHFSARGLEPVAH